MLKLKKLTIVANSHAVSDFSCPARYQFSQIRGIEPAKTNRPFLRGTVITELLSYYYQAKINGTFKATTCLDAIDLILDPSELSDEDKTLIGKRYLQYWKFYKNETWKPSIAEKCGLFDNSSNTGTGFSKVLYEDEHVLFVYEGEPDLIVSTGPFSGPNLVVDHKSQSRKKDLFDFSIQFRGYCWATGINDFCINYFGLQEKPAYFNGDSKAYFSRKMITYSKKHLEMWKTDMIATYFRILEAVQSNILPRTWQCDEVYGVCNFINLCRNSHIPEIVEDKIRREFKLRKRKASW